MHDHHNGLIFVILFNSDFSNVELQIAIKIEKIFPMFFELEKMNITDNKKLQFKIGCVEYESTLVFDAIVNFSAHCGP